jgi:C1A family cysteine protease
MGDNFVINPTGEYKEIAQIEYQKVGDLTSGNIRNLLLIHGPMVVDIWGDHSNDRLHHISTSNDNLSIIHQPSFGIFQNDEKVKVDHDVLLVGYGQNKQEQRFWILQNSWGSDWAYNGFFGILDDGRSPKEYFKHLAYVKNIDLKDVDVENIKKSAGTPKKTVKPVNLSLNNISVIEHYKDKIITETGSIPPPAGNDELNSFYSMLQTVPEIKRSETSSIYDSNLCWANKDNPSGKSIVVPTKSQGACGSCWIFAAMGMIQSAIAKKTNGKELFSLSEQWVLNSVQNAYNNRLPGWSGSGCNGGNTDMFKISINGFNNFDKKYGSFGSKSEETCPYNCQQYFNGETECADTTETCGPSIEQDVQKSDTDNRNSISPFVKNIQKFWDDNSLYVIIAIVIVFVIIFAMRA